VLEQITVSKNSVVQASPNQVSSELSDEVVILNIKAGVYHGLEATGTRIWQLVQQPRHVDEILDVLLSEFDVEREQCERDLVEVLEDLAAHGLLTVDLPAA